MQQIPEKPIVNLLKIQGELKRGETLSSSFKRAGVSDEVRLEVIRNFKGLLDFRDLRPHDQFSVTIDDNGSLVECLYESDPLTVHAIERNDDGTYFAQKKAISLEVKTIKIAGTINSSLFAAFMPYNEDPKLLYSFADIFASKIDFNTETREGDSFELVFEKYFKNGEFVGYGNILVARFDSRENGLLEGVYYESDSQYGSYFDSNGHELGASFIKSPVPMGRISSRFSSRRLHPVLKTVRPHLGVDLAAPVGTPIMAAADGKVNYVGWKGGFGKQVILDHGSGYRTYYGHLSRFSKGLTAGARVRQKQIIGYVGSTGLSTGPHLDYRISHNNVFKNPFALKFKPRSVLAGNELKRFRLYAAGLSDLAQSLDDPKVILVKNILVTPETRISML
ncbi:MAG: M23 family metallopeptidase [Desulfobulbaceae bacterium]|nr:M23 family metallopeptidase [Desulfobulbaceae bacterium]HIJ79097.1 M23 family metallopeptidase [Deltaproteobacteria bacterium]